ncbi:hypothetical protein CFP65_2153 [Kitasatospora sp. MMS16-BH015]|uniref:hypothetical protein n=1 Tax=Kitasatospora sp. MMS16-BH015 TaxID=2018025 RepID=UPI000CA387B7|nr:hypothetical protein [Kitasatospora sp. MMS16-BH015]AUG77005.1 hypothetical protein CFP65_2153 [Kitasatospora sp. MMS16-BH015]
MTPRFEDGLFEHELDAGLAALAEESEGPAPGFHQGVRARILRQRRRRRTALGTAAAACTAGVLAVALTAVGGPAPAQVLTPAGAPTTAPDSAAEPWWLTDPAAAQAPPTAVTRYWDAHGQGGPGAHREVRLLHQDFGPQVLYTLAGRRTDGTATVALLSGVREPDGSVPDSSLRLLREYPHPAQPPQPQAPFALAVSAAPGQPAPRTVEVLAPPCAGQPRLSTAPAGAPVSWHRDAFGALVTDRPVPADTPLSFRCDTSAGPGTEHVLLAPGAPVRVGPTAVSLLTSFAPASSAAMASAQPGSAG